MVLLELPQSQGAQAFQIKVETNLVVVKVVVRDAKGRAVAGLRKEDFRLFDGGKPQEITGFAAETAVAKALAAEAAAATAAPNLLPGTTTAPAPQRFVALYFDDLHMEFGAVGQIRAAAWRYVSATLRPEDRVAIFTTSNQNHLDFTGDRDKLHDAFFRLAPHSRTNPQERQCPAIGEYQAFLIAERQQTDVLDIAVQEGYHCHCEGINDTGDCRHAEYISAQMLAAQIWDLADKQSQYALGVMEGVVNLLATRPGQRSLVLVSPGFLSATRERSIDALIDRALRQNVVVNAIDAAGLDTKAYHDPILMNRPDLDTQKFRMENEALTVQRDVLAALAEGTGSTFFHNSNGFDEGLRQTAQAAEVYYLLSFSPHDVKLDGKFHALKVSLNTGDRWDVEARRGYFANATLAEKTSTKNELESALYSQDERQELPATITAQVENAAGGEAFTVTVKIHVDMRAVEFRKEADRSIDTLTFDTAVFDRDGKYVTAKESSLDFRLPDAKLEDLLKTGINAQTSFRLAPGTYRIREVVRDTESKKMSAMNYAVEVIAPPLQTAASTEPAAPVTPARAKKEKKTKSMAEWSIADFLKAMPELEGLDPAANQDRLPLLLANTGLNVRMFFETLPETSAHEQIDLERLDWAEHRKEEFNYLDVPRPVADGVGLDEFRTNAAGKRAEPLALEHGFVTTGFASMIVHFHPSYQSESTFRYLGTQQANGQSADVVYFAQIPGKARVKQSLKTDIRSLPILIQGVAWIDSRNFQIARMRTELLVPQGDPDLRAERTESRFAGVQFKGVAQVFGCRKKSR